MVGSLKTHVFNALDHIQCLCGQINVSCGLFFVSCVLIKCGFMRVFLNFLEYSVKDGFEKQKTSNDKKCGHVQKLCGQKAGK